MNPAFNDPYLPNPFDSVESEQPAPAPKTVAFEDYVRGELAALFKHIYEQEQQISRLTCEVQRLQSPKVPRPKSPMLPTLPDYELHRRNLTGAWDAGAKESFCKAMSNALAPVPPAAPQNTLNNAMCQASALLNTGVNVFEQSYNGQPLRFQK